MNLTECPFCGGTPAFNNSDVGAYEWIECTRCGARGSTFNYNREPGAAYAAWNKRWPAVKVWTGEPRNVFAPPNGANEDAGQGRA